MTQYEISLWVYLTCDEKLMAIKIGTVDYRQDNMALEKLMCVLYATVHSLAQKPITTNFPTLTTMKCCEGKHSVLSENCNLCVDKGIVMKMYDVQQKPYLKPNLPLIQAENTHLEYFYGGRIAFLKYNYICGNHKPQNLRCILDVIKNLIMMLGTFMETSVRRTLCTEMTTTLAQLSILISLPLKARGTHSSTHHSQMKEHRVQ